MKPHLVIKLKRPLPGFDALPHWQQFITDKSSARESTGTGVDAVMAKHATPFWVTLEYPPAQGAAFNQDERDLGFDRIYRLILQKNTELPSSLIDSIRLLPEVEFARSNDISRSPLPRFNEQQRFRGLSSWASEMIRLPEAHIHTKGDPGVVVAVLDTGIDPDHPELVGRVNGTADFVHLTGLDTTAFIGDVLNADKDAEDEVGHGTHVAGIIKAHGKKIPEGVCPNCSLLAVRVLATMKDGDERVGAGLVDNINVGIKWAVDQGADIINMSLGIRHEHGGLPHEEVIDYALRKGVTIVAASGNDGSDNKYYPGALPGVIAVGACGRDGRVAHFTSYGAHVSFLAPGTDILSAYREGNYVASSGTSQATPYVTGAIALLKSLAKKAGRRLADKDIKYILKNSADRNGRRWHDSRSGYGVINLADAFRLLKHSFSL